MWDEVGKHACGIFSDVDDTLTEGGVLVPEAYAALGQIRAAGLRMVLVTGRPRGWAEVMAAIFPIDAAIAENGAVAALPDGSRIYYDDPQTRQEGMTRRAAARAHVLHDMPWVLPSRDEPLREIDLAFDVNEHAHLSEADVSRARGILEEHGLSTTISSIHLHGTFSRGDKGSMCARLAQTLWGDDERAVRSRYIFVGDSPNDLPAFSLFERSVGVANVARHLDALAAHGAAPWAMTAAPGGRGFAEFATKLLLARQRVSQKP